MFSLNEINLNFGKLRLFEDFTLTSQKQEFTCLFGPSGVGKSSVLNLLAGLIKPDSGRVEVGGAKVGYVFQDPRLLPWCTVQENIALGLYGLKLSPRIIKLKVDGLVEKLELQGFAAYYPNQLSGGMKQRVALGRAFAIEPDLLLMDEPFAALDEKLKAEMRSLLLELITWNRCTTVFVTHDLEEAIQLADRIIVMGNRPCTIKTTIYIKPELRYDRNYNEELKKRLVS